ncbi:nucleoside deaminase [Pseudomonas proteolytica]|uniref:nucleoside deaminase n=1 Tax=Pseudomonas proteolytica TaxID=219574 RepID=UPI001475F7F8|nr:nucleoside deaminase [Pseudomonas proteolytica]NMZ01223.1 nucleoside deaminase [Pseudomonas proteolytica]NMZ11623.1 nucleoside deaminase [Pseudomonas proteolytica]
MSPQHDQAWLQRAVALAQDNVAQGGRPFGAVLVKDGAVLVEAVNQIHLDQDPTAHAEMLAIRRASQQLGPRLEGCVIYASGQPCPMCLGAMYLCGVARVVFAASNEMAAPFGLSTAAVYQQMSLPLTAQQLPVEHLPMPAMQALYRQWKTLHDPE